MNLFLLQVVKDFFSLQNELAILEQKKAGERVLKLAEEQKVCNFSS